VTTFAGRLLTIEEYAALGETEMGYTELMEGRVVMSPNPGAVHNLAMFSLACQIDPQLPADLALVHAIDVDLRLAPRGEPGFSRRPDLIVFAEDALARVRREGPMLRAEEVAVVVEIVSPGSKRTDCLDAAAVTGTFTTDVPFPVKIDLDGLLP
jgi:Uma2 family endonuclease